jgi:NAD+ kinase
MPTVGLLINESKPRALEDAERLAHALTERGVSVRACAVLGDRVAAEFRCSDEAEIAGADFVVVFGGDGTLLSAARLLAPHGTPMLGVHLGTFGFIAETLPGDGLFPAVERVLDGDFRVDERLMLACTVRRAADGREEATPFGMNDVVVASGATRMVQVRTEVGGDVVATYAADGVIVASPTGSTGYSLSAGGPLVHPSAPVLLITPISPHTLNARTLIVPDTETVLLAPDSGDARDVVVATVDGQIKVPLAPGDTVCVRRAAHPARLISVGGPNFYHKLRARWRYGERLQG